MNLVYAIALLLLFYFLIVGEFFLPTGGLMGVAALMTVVLSLVFAFSHSTTAGVTVSGIVLITTPMVFYGMVRVWPHTPIGRRMLNRRPGQQTESPQKRTTPDGTPLENLVGQSGIAKTDLLPSGRVQIGENKLDAISIGMPIDKGSEIVVTNVDAGRIHVRLMTDSDRQQAAPATPQSPPSLEDSLDSFDFE